MEFLYDEAAIFNYLANESHRILFISFVRIYRFILYRWRVLSSRCRSGFRSYKCLIFYRDSCITHYAKWLFTKKSQRDVQLMTPHASQSSAKRGERQFLFLSDRQKVWIWSIGYACVVGVSPGKKFPAGNFSFARVVRRRCLSLSLSLSLFFLSCRSWERNATKSGRHGITHDLLLPFSSHNLCGIFLLSRDNAKCTRRLSCAYARGKRQSSFHDAITLLARIFFFRIVKSFRICFAHKTEKS